MGEKLEMDPAKTSLAISILLFALIILAGCGSFATQTPATTSSQATGAPAAVATSAGLPVQTGSRADSQPPANLPSPVETILATRVAPPTIPAAGTPPPLPVPPEAQQLGQLPPEMNPTIAWGVETSATVSLWLGAYSNNPQPQLRDATPLLRWRGALKLISITSSPDHRFLAVLLEESSDRPTGPPRWLMVVDIRSGQVQAIPDYRQSVLYARAFYAPPQRVLGWLDNEQIAVSDNAAIQIAGRDGRSYARVPLPDKASAIAAALGPDRGTFFSAMIGGMTGWWLHDRNGGQRRRLDGGITLPSVYEPEWSPDGRLISFLSPAIVNGYQDLTRTGVWLLDVHDGQIHTLSSGPGWSGDPVWSANGSRIAFLHREQPSPGGPSGDFSSNVFVADMRAPAGGAARPLTTFADALNRDLDWTTNGDLVLSSTFGGERGEWNLIAVDSQSGAASVLLRGSADEALVRPAMIK